MKFYDRLEELDYLHEVYRQSADNARFTVVTGRRRIGKTSLLLKAYEGEPMLYFFVARKSESDLCESYLDEIKRVFDVSMLGKCDRFIDIFEWLMEFSEKQHFTLVIDEFQEFFRVNQSVFSDMQRIWDKYEKTSHINLIVCGSVYSMMSKIFKDKKEPLYGRGTGELRVKPFRPSVLKQILADANPDFANEDLLALFSFTGGVAKYVQLLVDAKALTKEAMIDYIIPQLDGQVESTSTIEKPLPFCWFSNALRIIFLVSRICGTVSTAVRTASAVPSSVDSISQTWIG